MDRCAKFPKLSFRLVDHRTVDPPTSEVLAQYLEPCRPAIVSEAPMAAREECTDPDSLALTQTPNPDVAIVDQAAATHQPAASPLAASPLAASPLISEQSGAEGRQRLCGMAFGGSTGCPLVAIASADRGEVLVLDLKQPSILQAIKELVTDPAVVKVGLWTTLDALSLGTDVQSCAVVDLRAGQICRALLPPLSDQMSTTRDKALQSSVLSCGCEHRVSQPDLVEQISCQTLPSVSRLLQVLLLDTKATWSGVHQQPEEACYEEQLKCLVLDAMACAQIGDMLQRRDQLHPKRGISTDLDRSVLEAIGVIVQQQHCFMCLEPGEARVLYNNIQLCSCESPGSCECLKGPQAKKKKKVHKPKMKMQKKKCSTLVVRCSDYRTSLRSASAVTVHLIDGTHHPARILKLSPPYCHIHLTERLDSSDQVSAIYHSAHDPAEVQTLDCLVRAAYGSDAQHWQGYVGELYSTAHTPNDAAGIPRPERVQLASFEITQKKGSQKQCHKMAIRRQSALSLLLDSVDRWALSSVRRCFEYFIRARAFGQQPFRAGIEQSMSRLNDQQQTAVVDSLCHYSRGVISVDAPPGRSQATQPVADSCCC